MIADFNQLEGQYEELRREATDIVEQLNGIADEIRTGWRVSLDAGPDSPQVGWLVAIAISTGRLNQLISILDEYITLNIKLFRILSKAMAIRTQMGILRDRISFDRVIFGLPVVVPQMPKMIGLNLKFNGNEVIEAWFEAMEAENLPFRPDKPPRR